MTDDSGGKRIVIVGGVAGGASCAARARRLSESARIVMVEKGPYVSFANCGLPYHIGGEIADRQKLILNSPESLASRFGMDVRVRTEAIAVDPKAQTVRLRDLQTGEETDEPYDELVLSPGAAPLRPPIPGIDRPGHFTLRNVPDTDAINAWISGQNAKRAVVVGGGYIGLEMAEQLIHRGLAVTLIELAPQVMAPLDPEMAEHLHRALRKHGVDLRLSDGVQQFDEPAPGSDAAASVVVTKKGERFPADVVVMGLGVRPDIRWLGGANIATGVTGGIAVDDFLRTSVPHIWAVGDAIEVHDPIFGEPAHIPLAGPANRQGRLVADNIFAESQNDLIPYDGTYGTAILRLFEVAAGCTGLSEKRLLKMNVPHEIIRIHRPHHVTYYPGAEMMDIKALFHREDGRLLGAQIVGGEGVDRRLDVFATALAADMTADDLAELELTYAPPFGAAKDPVNIVGMAAQNALSGFVDPIDWVELAQRDPASYYLLDVRNPPERENGKVILPRPGAESHNIPLDQLRARLGELPRDRDIVVHCQSGQRSYYACRILEQNGFNCRNLSGSYLTWQMAKDVLERQEGKDQ
ncbi:MAG: FAD-dependent oxidoreductase [Sumerlaeia bacterium]